MGQYTLQEALTATGGVLYDPRKIRNLINITVWCLLAMMTISACILLFRSFGLLLAPNKTVSFFELGFILSGSYPNIESFPFTLGTLLLSYVQNFADSSFLAFFAVLLIWLQRILKNLQTLGLQDDEYSPSRAVVYLMIPAWNLFYISKYMQYAWRASNGFRQWQQIDRDRETEFWCWTIIGLLVAYISGVWLVSHMRNTHTIAIYLVSQALFRLIFAVFNVSWTLRIISRITRAHEALLQHAPEIMQQNEVQAAILSNEQSQQRGPKYIAHFKPSVNRTVILVTVLIAAAGGLAVLVSDIMQWSMLHGGDYTQAQAHANDARQSVVNSFSYLTRFLFLAGLMLWTYRASKNVQDFGVKDLSHSPLSAGWFYIIPLINLVHGARCVQEIWRASINPGRWPYVYENQYITNWWIGVVAVFLAPVALSWFGPDTGNPHGMLLYTQWYLLIDVAFLLVVCYITYWITQKVNRAQARLIETQTPIESTDMVEPVPERYQQTYKVSPEEPNDEENR